MGERLVGDADANARAVGTSSGDVPDVDLPNPDLDALATPAMIFFRWPRANMPLTTSNYDNPAAPAYDSLVFPGAGDHAPEIIGDETLVISRRCLCVNLKKGNSP